MCLHCTGWTKRYCTSSNPYRTFVTITKIFYHSLDHFAGHYVYIDTEFMSKGQMAVFGPKTYIQPTRIVSRYCLKLCYYIYGVFMGNISVVIGYKNEEFNNSLVWQETGKYLLLLLLLLLFFFQKRKYRVFIPVCVCVCVCQLCFHVPVFFAQ